MSMDQIFLFLSVLVLTISGCRFGNFTNQTISQSSSDPYSGYYSTQPKSLILMVTTPHLQQQTVDVSQLPTQISQYLPNPVVLVMNDLTTGTGFLTDPSWLTQNEIPSLPTLVRPDYSILYQGSSSPLQLWRDPACQSTVYLNEAGSITKSALAGSSSTGTSHSVSGKLTLKISVTTQLTGDCTSTLQQIADCYQDESKCGGSTEASNLKLQAAIRSIFDLYVQNQVLGLTDLPALTSYAYEATYE